MIVANAARDHEKVIEWALSVGAAVLAEKPIALSAGAAHRLAQLAHLRGARFAAAHVFLFARYLENFARCLADAQAIRGLRVQWMDPRTESRHGEEKRFDPGLSILADWLPHVSSMIGALTPGLSQRCESVRVLRGGAHVELDLTIGELPCSAQLIRNGERRQRLTEVFTAGGTLQLDFSKEPGTIHDGATTISGDAEWTMKSRPVATMLSAFLRWAAGGAFDERLSIGIALCAAELIDRATDLYDTAVVAWLAEKLRSPAETDEELRYALGEILQSRGPLPAATIEQQIERVRRHFCSTADPAWLRALVASRDPSLILSTLGAAP